MNVPSYAFPMVVCSFMPSSWASDRCVCMCVCVCVYICTCVCAH